jgi:prevent-host-death family protein
MRVVREIGAFEAKNKLGTLLDWVERGERVLITRRGKAMARLLPVELGFDCAKARRAADGIIEARRGVTLDGLGIKELVDEGRLCVFSDSSVTLSGCFDDERTDASDAQLEQVVGSGAEAPSLWPLEILNALAIAGRRDRIDSDRR